MMPVIDNPPARLGGNLAFFCLASNGQPRFCAPYHVEFKADQFAGELDVDFHDVPGFIGEVEKMYAALDGSASLESYEGDFTVTLTSQEFGGVGVKVQVSKCNGGPLEYDLTFQFDLDQSYLPEFVRALKASVQ